MFLLIFYDTLTLFICYHLEVKVLWIDASDIFNHKQWVWASTGRSLNSTFSDWGDKEPNNAKGKRAKEL